MAKFMIKSMFTPSLTVNPQSQTENNSPWHIPGSPIHMQQASIAQLLGMINASHQALNHSNPPLVSDGWICMKSGPVQYLGVILNQSTVSLPTSAPGTSDYPFLAPVLLYGNSSSPITGHSWVYAPNNTFLACDQGVYICITCVINHAYLSVSYLIFQSSLGTMPHSYGDLLATLDTPSQPSLLS